MYSWSSTLSRILLKNSFGKVFFFQILVMWLFRKTKIRFFFCRHFETKHFLIVCLFVCFFGWYIVVLGVYTRCKFRTEIPSEKYSKMNVSKFTPPPCAQTGVKSNTYVYTNLVPCMRISHNAYWWTNIRALQLSYRLLLGIIWRWPICFTLARRETVRNATNGRKDQKWYKPVKLWK